jgi:phosphonate metabolism protein PhnN/1,5-bisphosphokinase (PRPP-forming)
MLVLVVGPSGAGKDTLINAAKLALAGDARFVFPRRAVTRPAMAELEDHDSVTPEQFALHEANGDYALTWEAHGLKYGLPASIRDDIAMGRVVVMNGSRAMVPIAREPLPGTVVVLVGASPQVRAQRLARRGRETAAQISARLAREVDVDIPNAILVDNSGELEQGKARFLARLRSLRAN